MLTVERLEEGTGPLRWLVRRAVASDPFAFDATSADIGALPADYWTMLVAEPAAAFAAIVGGVHVGVCGEHRVIEPAAERWAVLRNLWVDPGFRRRGAATRLVDAVEDWAVQSGAVKMSLTVRLSQMPAVRMYRERGLDRLSDRGEGLDQLRDEPDVDRAAFSVAASSICLGRGGGGSPHFRLEGEGLHGCCHSAWSVVRCPRSGSYRGPVHR